MNHAQTVRFLKSLTPTKARLLRGSSGVGKDALVAEFAAQNKSTVIPLYLGEMEPTDVIGLPYIHDGQTKYARPYWWPTKPNQILFLNEIDRTGEAMFPIAMRLALDRMAGGLKLPADTIVFAACNGERYMTQPLDQAVLRRFAVIDYQPTVDEWLKWAESVEISRTIFDYISANPNQLDTPADLIGKRNRVVQTRASWVDFSNWLINSNPAPDPDELAIFAAPFIGEQAARDFAAWVETRATQLAAEEIFAGTANSTETTLLQASHAAGQVAMKFMAAGLKSQNNALDFYLAVGQEALAALFAELPKETAPIIKQHKSAHQAIMKVIGSI